MLESVNQAASRVALVGRNVDIPLMAVQCVTSHAGVDVVRRAGCRDNRFIVIARILGTPIVRMHGRFFLASSRAEACLG